VPAKPNPDKKGFFRYALALDGNDWNDNGYRADLKASGKYNEQIAAWMQKVGGGEALNGLKVLYHDDPVKTDFVRQLFKDTYDEVKPLFAKPTVPAEGGE
jgi:hypothetical protein